LFDTGVVGGKGVIDELLEDGGGWVDEGLMVFVACIKEEVG